MFRTALAFPVLPGKTLDDITLISRMFESRPDEYRESRSRHGVSLERAYLQKTPMGDFVVAYVESERPAAEAMGGMVGSDLAIDKEFVRHVLDVHGVDLSVAPATKAPETIGEWADPQVTERRAGLAFCAPMIPEREAQGRAFTKEAFGTRVAEFAESRRALEQNIEVVTLLDTPMGPITAVYLEGTDPVQGNVKFTQSTSTFDTWFRGQLAELYPPQIDMSKPVPGLSEIFDSAKLLVAR